MFFKKEKSQLAELVPSSRGQRSLSPEEAETLAIDALSAVLRTLGHHAFDLEERNREDVRDQFEKWALRLLLGETRSPGGSGDAKPSRDYGGLRQFVENHRREESDYVVSALDNLRNAVRTFTRSTTHSLRHGRESNSQMSREVVALERALASKDHALIRKSAERTAVTLRHELESQRLRETAQLEELKQAFLGLKHELEQTKKAALTDALTQTYNRAALDEHIALVADQAFLSSSPACIVMVDIDHFKAVNDNYGHPTGDEVLKRVADAIVRGFLRREDFIARYGGEEFCIVAQSTTFEATRDRAERLRRSIEEMKIEAFGKKLHVSVSFGIAQLGSGESGKSWLRRADEALYRAKRKGRNRISVAPHDEEFCASSDPGPPASQPSPKAGGLAGQEHALKGPVLLGTR